MLNNNKLLTQAEISKESGLSQQTVSRKLKELEEEGIIQRIIVKEGEYIKLTDKGEEELKKCIEDILQLIMRTKILRIRGKVTAGLGEGRIFLSIPYYIDSFKKYLGFEPYAGTLNIVIYDRISLENRLILDLAKGIIIPEYKEPNRVLGSVKAFPSSINSISPAAIVIPARTTHPKSVIEVISPYYLREKLNLKDGDEVEIEVYL
ncbi:CTP-dependent riboflavin kinase [Sulfolobus sp. S-194]|uniref:DUF120 domain-containing protein n=1 Tax=Sulfolobus sp. S-194 TaxID=2512240 RepID=UPI0014370A86|nr:DUF120 domain-containing protein [Sulfolobus sp. S-194]QIW24193.1 CTP-dependent riboflavin kinase [Sulfolobus sp. S-194]